MPWEEEAPWSAGAAAAGSYLGGVEQKRQRQVEEERNRQSDAYQRALAQQSASRLALETQRAGRESKKFSEDEADRAKGISQAAAIQQLNDHIANTPIPPPPKGATEAQKADYYASYLSKRLPQEMRLPGNEEGVKSTQELIRDWQTRGNQARTREDEDRRAALALAQAKALHADTEQHQDQRFAQGLAGYNARFSAGQAGDDARQQAGFKHQDKAAAARTAQSTTDARASLAAKKAAAALKAGVPVSDLRRAFKADGYDDATINRILPPEQPGPPAPPPTPAPFKWPWAQ